MAAHPETSPRRYCGIEHHGMRLLRAPREGWNDGEAIYLFIFLFFFFFFFEQSFEQVAKREKAHGDSIWSVTWRDKYIVSGSVNGHVKAWTESLEPHADYAASSLSVVSVASTGKRTSLYAPLFARVRACSCPLWTLIVVLLLLFLTDSLFFSSSLSCRRHFKYFG
jgi:preprotein translocase subunit YajC